MSDTPPDRLCNDPRSKFYDREILARGIGIRFNGAEKTTVEEYCVSEGWVRMAVPRALDRHGRPMTLKFKGEVVAYFLDAAATPPAETPSPETSPDDAANPPSPA